MVRAPSPRDALEELRRQRLVPVELAVDGGARARGALPLGRAPSVALFARTVATLLGSGVPIDHALSFGAEQAGHPDVEAAARDVRRHVREGWSFSEALGRHRALFGSLFLAAASAGEETGSLDQAMARLADHLDEAAELRAQLRSALLYPALMAVVSGVGVTVLLLFVVPRFAAMMAEEGATLPLSTRVLVGSSGALVRGGWLLLVAAVAGVLGARLWLEAPANRRRWHAARLAVPLAGELERRQDTALFLRAFALLLESGRATVPALDAARGAVGNLELAAGLERAAESVRQGEPLHAALEGTLPALATELIAVGEESARLGEMAVRAAEAYERDVRRSLRALVGVVEPALILVFAVIVGFVALAMLQAIYGVSASAL